MADFINFTELARQCSPQVDPTTMSILIRHESNAKPYAIGVNGTYVLPHQPKTQEEAIKKAKWLMARGYNFDAGLAQINIKNIHRLGMTVSDLFDPCENLRAASKILTDCYARAAVRYDDEQKSIRAALSCYNTGNFSQGFVNGYVKKVIKKVPPITDAEVDLMQKVMLPHSQIIVPKLLVEEVKKKDTKKMRGIKNK